MAVLEVALGSSNDRKKYLASLSTSSSSTRSTLGVDVEVDVEVDAGALLSISAALEKINFSLACLNRIILFFKSNI